MPQNLLYSKKRGEREPGKRLHCTLRIPSIRFYWPAIVVRYAIGRRLVVSVVRAFAPFGGSSSLPRRRRPSPPHLHSQWRPTTVTSTRICPRHLRSACDTRSPTKSPKVRISKLLDRDLLGSRPANVTVSKARRVRYTRRIAIMADIFPVCLPAVAGRAPSTHLLPVGDVIGSLSFPRYVRRLFQVPATHVVGHVIIVDLEFRPVNIIVF